MLRRLIARLRGWARDGSAASVSAETLEQRRKAENDYAQYGGGRL
jgi:hypothetical protein